MIFPGADQVEDALRYVLSLPISTLVSGIDSEKVLDQNLKIVRNFRPLTAEERQAIEQRTFALAGDGRFELFKSSKAFDGPVHRKQHGFATNIDTAGEFAWWVENRGFSLLRVPQPAQALAYRPPRGIRQQYQYRMKNGG